MTDMIEWVNALGPYGFGLVVFLVIWKVVIRPEIERQQRAAELMHALVKAINEHEQVHSTQVDALMRFVSAQTQALEGVVAQMGQVTDTLRRMQQSSHPQPNSRSQP